MENTKVKMAVEQYIRHELNNGKSEPMLLMDELKVTSILTDMVFSHNLYRHNGIRFAADVLY